jgi:hypothetical protein
LKSSAKSAELIGQDAALLSVCEVGLGSILHAFHVPLTGYFLSLNQIFLISRSMFKTEQRLVPAQISCIAAVLKSLSPAGKKLTPMLAISMQGLLFSFGTIVLGANLVGGITGAIVSSTWSFIQPALLYYFFFGAPLFAAIELFLKKIGETFDLSATRADFYLFVIFVVAVKALLSAALVVLAKYLPESKFQDWQKRLLGNAKLKISQSKDVATKRLKDHITGALSDLWNPLFLISIILTIVFFVFSESSFSQIIWYLLRPIATAFVVFLLVRLIPMQTYAHRWPSLAHAMNKIKNK